MRSSPTGCEEGLSQLDRALIWRRPSQQLSASLVLTAAVCCRGYGHKRDRQGSEGQSARGELFASHAREIVVGFQLQLPAVQTHSAVGNISGIKRVTLRSAAEHQRARGAGIGIDDENSNAAGGAALAVCIDMESCLMGYAGIQHAACHQFAPQQRTPVIRSRRQSLLIQQAVVARRKRVVHHNLSAGSGQSPKLIEISERIEEGRVPSVPAARRLRRFRQPDWLSGREPISNRTVEGEDPNGFRKPLFGNGLIKSVWSAAPFRKRAIVMI